MIKVSAQFLPGKVHLLVGSSGSGKSRFLQALAGLQRHTGERICISQKGRFKYDGILSNVLYIEQFPYCLADTVQANLQISASLSSDASIKQVLSTVGLSHLNELKQWLGENGRLLSGGEKKKIGLARALLSPANVILLDEPFEALDPQSIEKVCKVINNLAKQKLVLVASHIIPVALVYAQQISLDPANDMHLLSKGINYE